MSDSSQHHLSTRVIHGGQHVDPATGAVSVPIYQSSTFAFRSADEGAGRFLGTEPGYIYTRLGNPTIAALEASIANLEGGVGALGAATGMAAVQTVYFALLGQGAHVVATDALYGPSRMVLETEYTRFGVKATFVDSTNPDNVARAMRPETRLVYVESPSNPTMAVTDIAACAAIARAGGALLCVDNTFASPLLQRPLELGADVVLHSLTKFLNGHSDVVGGVVVARDPELFARLRKVHRNLGGTMDPHQAWLVLRGIKTLAMRIERAQANARTVAAFLEADPRIEWVRYPGLASHPQHALASRQMAGPGAVLSFGVRGGFAAAKTMIESCQLATLAVSLGGIETLIEHPASMTHSSVPRADREAAGITDDLVRLAVGCEDERDIVADLDQALARAQAALAAP
jgi:methionine-gamma-lyase